MSAHVEELAGKVLLACGILATLLYAATDILGGLRYEGYSFWSQAISELGAIGAPSEAFVDPLFTMYTVLALAFGIAVLREGVGRSRALLIAGILLTAHAAIGLLGPVVLGPTFFKIQQRGAGSLATDLPHIVLIGVTVLLLLLAMGFGAFALGRRFRVYSFAALLTFAAFSALTVPYAARVAARQPTPGFGIVERIAVYSALIWIAVLAVALLRRRGTAPQPSGVS